MIVESPSTSLEKVDRNLSNIFETAPMDATLLDANNRVVAQLPESDVADRQKIDADADFARNNIYTLVQQGQDALQYAIDLAKQSDSPRAFEVVGALLKNLTDMNMQLLDSHEKKAKINAARKQPDPAPEKVVNNSIVFNGTTAQLNDMLKTMKREN